MSNIAVIITSNIAVNITMGMFYSGHLLSIEASFQDRKKDCRCFLLFGSLCLLSSGNEVPIAVVYVHSFLRFGRSF